METSTGGGGGDTAAAGVHRRHRRRAYGAGDAVGECGRDAGSEPLLPHGVAVVVERCLHARRGPGAADGGGGVRPFPRRYTDADADPRTEAFAAAYRDRHGHAPAPWAAEAYDAVRFAAHGLTAAGADGRAALRAELLRRPWQGITRRTVFDTGDQFFDAKAGGGAFLHRVTDGTVRFVARDAGIGRG
ncbi:ABC transporter substrate-binding protein [Streptomyces sp. NPDC003247]|uniref:ABC transporter substrate-binding protein n=1 Tax=Streptomyces sp. NPDC003247 TaxID=3364677 RepID=UPI0036888B67